MNLSRIWALNKIIFQAHVFNWAWRPRSVRSEVRTQVLSKIAPEYFKRYLPNPAKLKEEKVVNNDKNEKIFTIWQQGEDDMPDIVKACLKSIRKHCKQELVVLNDKTIFDYIELPKIIIEKYERGQIRRAHFSDICRVELLYKYGGYWLDATGFVTAPIPEWITEEDFFVYLVGDKVGQKYMFMQNCFIRARKNSYLLGAWREMILNYWTNEPKSFDYFMHQLMFFTLVSKDERAKKYFEKMPHIDQYPTHALWHSMKNEPFNKKTFDKLTKDAFFQKVSHNYGAKPGNFAQAKPGSFAQAMIDMYIK